MVAHREGEPGVRVIPLAAPFLAETTLGPFFVGGSVGDNSHHKWFFQLGHVF